MWWNVPLAGKERLRNHHHRDLTLQGQREVVYVVCHRHTLTLPAETCLPIEPSRISSRSWSPPSPMTQRSHSLTRSIFSVLLMVTRQESLPAGHFSDVWARRCECGQCSEFFLWFFVLASFVLNFRATRWETKLFWNVSQPSFNRHTFYELAVWVIRLVITYLLYLYDMTSTDHFRVFKNRLHVSGAMSVDGWLNKLESQIYSQLSSVVLKAPWEIPSPYVFAFQVAKCIEKKAGVQNTMHLYTWRLVENQSGRWFHSQSAGEK